jgi:hypothetical protein
MVGMKAIAAAASSTAWLAVAVFLPAPAALAAPDAVPYQVTEISVGDGNTVCVLGSDQGVDCFGGDGDGVADVGGEDQPGPYIAVGTGKAMPAGQNTCGLTPAGDVDCWGPGAARFRQPGPYATLSVGAYRACGLTPDGDADCWDGPGSARHYSGPFRAVSAGETGFCAVTDLGEVSCYDLDPEFEAAAHRAGPYTSVNFGSLVGGICATTTGGDVDCWDPLGGFTDYTIAGPLSDVTGDGTRDCGLTPVGAVRCWDGSTGSPEANNLFAHGPYQSVDVGYFDLGPDGTRACALRTTGVPDCVSYPDWGAVAHPGGQPLLGFSRSTDPVAVVGQSVSTGHFTTLPTAVQVRYAVVSGSLPPGVSIGPDGRVTGTPTAAGHYTATVRADNLWGSDQMESFVIDVDDDTDHDGIGNTTDPDDDNDGLPDAGDPYPLLDDGDGDGAPDGSDNCPTTANADQADLDGDDVGDACDPDIDGDGVPNASDAFPTNAGESLDTDGDGIGNNADTDDDGDGIPDAQDGFPLEKDGPLSGVLSRQIKANPALAPLLTPVRASLLALGL